MSNRARIFFSVFLALAWGLLGGAPTPSHAQTRAWVPNAWMGSGAPVASFGSEGQWYLDVATGKAYGPKATGSWPAGSPIIVVTAFPATVSGGVSGGIPCFTSTTVEAASTLLAANAVVIGGGAGACPTSTTTGTGVVTGIGLPINTAGGFVTASAASIASGSILTGGGSATAISGIVPGTGVATGLAAAVNTAGGFPTASAASIVSGAILTGGGSGTALAAITPGTGIATALAANTNAASGFVALDANLKLTAPATIQAGGTKPTASASGGTCAVTATPTAGGTNAGTVAITGVCAATDTITLTWGASLAATAGWVCEARNRTVPADLIEQTSTSTTTAVFTHRGTSSGSADVMQFSCLAD